MKKVLIILGLFAFVTIMGIGGCIYWFVDAVSFPEYVNRKNIMKDYGSDIKKIKSQLDKGVALTYSADEFKLNDDIKRINKKTIAGNDFGDVYKRYVYSGQIHGMSRFTIDINGIKMTTGIGVGTLTSDSETIHVIIYMFDHDGSEYIIFIKDHNYKENIQNQDKK